LCSAPNKQGARHYAERPVAAEQRDGDAHETVFGGEAKLEPGRISKDLGDADQAGETAGER